jgi:hypothetical protein
MIREYLDYEGWWGDTGPLPILKSPMPLPSKKKTNSSRGGFGESAPGRQGRKKLIQRIKNTNGASGTLLLLSRGRDS